MPALFGLVFYVAMFLGGNWALLKAYPILNLLGIFCCAAFLYAFVFGVIKNPLNLAVGVSGFKWSRILVGLILPFILFVYQRFFYKPKEQFNSLLQKEQKFMERDSERCISMKYGTFTDGRDTVIRFQEDKRDFELIKSSGEEATTRITWIDSCMYYTVSEKGLVLKIVQLGNFDADGSFEEYSKPGFIHELDDEKILRLRKVD